MCFEHIDVLGAECAFVLVAGGLGERLGYGGIKVALPSESTTGTSYLQLYVELVQRWQASAGATTASGAPATPAPFVIMTSDDTHEQTTELLAAHDSFGLAPGQLHVLKQEKVAAMVDSSAHLAMVDAFTVDTKPHGHGDVHTVLHRHGLPQRWIEEGER